MSPIERLRWAVAPVQARGIALVLWGALAFGTVGVVATLIELPRVVDALLALVMLVAWVVGLCGMVGYFRWYFNPKSHQTVEPDSTRRKA